jgi:PH domain
VVLVTGHLLFYKEDPAKSKKKDKLSPVFVVVLESITIKKDVKLLKAKCFHLVSKNAAVWAIQGNSDNEIMEWMQVIPECTCENSTEFDVENGMCC